jgi:S-adenosylmethionine hydrolase
MELITLTTDFGDADGYPAAMKGVILGINPNVRIIDISHAIESQNILHGAYVLFSIVEYYSHAIHVGVIDPGVGTDRAGLVFRCEKGILIGPDNGLLVQAAQRLGIESVFNINNPEFWLKDISSTFHGRDIFAPVAAHIARGVLIEDIGERTDHFIELNLFDAKEEGNHIIGKVLNIDKFGNIITNIPQKIVKKHFNFDDKILINYENDKDSNEQSLKIPYQTTYNDVPKRSLVAIISSSGFLEFAGNQCRADDILKLNISDNVSVQK